MTLVAIFFVDRIGRKPLLYVGLAGMFLALATLASPSRSRTSPASLGTIALISMMVYVGCFAFSLGPIVWLLISEIFPLQVRGLGMSLSTLANWVGNFLVSQFFLTMVEQLGRPRRSGSTRCFASSRSSSCGRWFPRRNASCWSVSASLPRTHRPE